MIFTLVLRSLLAHPIRSAVLAGGFGLGVAVVAALLGIGSVILDQARAPALAGGGDVVVGGASGRLPNARFILSGVFGDGPLGARVRAASPTARATLYLATGGRAVTVRATGAIPSLDRALGNPETRGIGAWRDTPADGAWAHPNPADVLRAMDRFHPIPDVPARADSWAEWLYFNGRAGSARFYLTFLAGPAVKSGRRRVGVRLQLERNGRMTSFGDMNDVDADTLLQGAPDMTSGLNRVRLIGEDYHITLDLPSESGRTRAAGELVVRGRAGYSLPPFEIRGAGGWASGYVVPVMSGDVHGALHVAGDTIDFAGGSGYHDHNWGFWDGVTWQWGQVQGDGLSFVYGRIRPPADAADASRIPGFLMAIGPDGPVGYATDVTIDETVDPASGQPRRIVAQGRSDSIALTLDLAVDQIVITPMRGTTFGSGMDFLQMRTRARVTGRAGDREIAFESSGSAETFRGGRDR